MVPLTVKVQPQLQKENMCFLSKKLENSKCLLLQRIESRLSGWWSRPSCYPECHKWQCYTTTDTTNYNPSFHPCDLFWLVLYVPLIKSQSRSKQTTSLGCWTHDSQFCLFFGNVAFTIYAAQNAKCLFEFSSFNISSLSSKHYASQNLVLLKCFK